MVDIVKWTDSRLHADAVIVGRPDQFLVDNSFQRHEVLTPFGLCSRYYVGEYGDIRIGVIYGRFAHAQTPSGDIPFEQTQWVVNSSGAKLMVGTFVTGRLADDVTLGTIVIPHDFVGVDAANNSLYRRGGFQPVDMKVPFCRPLRQALIQAARDQQIQAREKGIYACFHTFPRLETMAELEYLKRNGWTVVGQTLDPEATLARESAVCYAAVCVAVDDEEVRGKLTTDERPAALARIRDTIRDGRRRTFRIAVEAVAAEVKRRRDEPAGCNCNLDIYQRPGPTPAEFRPLPPWFYEQ